MTTTSSPNNTRVRNTESELGSKRQRPCVLRRGDVELHFGTKRVWRFGRPLRMSDRSFDLLALLALKPDRVHGRLEILEAIWGCGSGVELRSVDQEIARLRRCLNLWESPDPIRSIRGKGYKFDACFASQNGNKHTRLNKLKLGR